MRGSSFFRLIALICFATFASSGVRAESVALNGINDHVAIAPDVTLGESSFTVEAWFKRALGGRPTTVGNGTGFSVIPLVSRGYASAFCLAIDGSGGLFGAVSNSTTRFTVRSANVIPMGEWHHGAVTYDGAALKIYLDGQLVGQSAANGLVSYVAPGTRIGQILSYSVTDGAFSGNIDEVRMWNYARSAAEIDAHKAVALKFAPGLIVRWGFDGAASATTTSDGTSAIAATLAVSAVYSADVPPFPTSAPTASITAPLGNVTATRGIALPLTASASDPDDAVARVEFYAGSVKLGESVTPPFTLNAQFESLGPVPVRAVAVDAAGHVNGTNTGPTVTVVVPPGAEAVYFSGASWAETSQPTALGVSEFTIEAWFSLEGNGVPVDLGQGFGSVVSLVNRGVATYDMNYLLGIRPSDNRLVGGLVRGGPASFAVSATPISRSAWHHAAVSFDGVFVRLYLDGNLEAELRSSTTPNLVNPMPTHLGALTTSYSGSALLGGLFDGVIDEVRIWSYARPLAAIRGARFLNQPIAPQLTARWAMDGSAGATLVNSVSAFLNATLIGTTTRTTGAPLQTGQPPAVSLSSPTGPVTLSRGQTQSLFATASDPDGTVARVEFWDGAQKIGEKATTPYTFSWPAVPIGTRRISAVAIDNAGFASASPTVAATVTPPSGAGGIYLDGDNDGVTSTTAYAIAYNSSFTVEGWFRREEVGRTFPADNVTSVEPMIVNQSAYNFSGSFAYLLGIRPSDGVLFAGYDDKGFGGVTPVGYGVWRHAALSFDGAMLRLYLDGQLEAQMPATPPTSGRGGWLSFGGHPYQSAYPACFAGNLDEIRVWNYARSASEIAGARSLALTSAPGLGARWGFGEGSGTTATSSGTEIIASTLTPGVVWSPGVTAASGSAPTVSITAPADSASVPVLTPLAVSVAAADTDGSVVRVELYVGATKVAERTTAPWTFTFEPQVIGAQTLRAVAVDNAGLATTSPLIVVQGVPPSGGDGLFFDGTTSRVVLPPGGELAMERFTVEAWVRKASGGTTANNGYGNYLPIVARGTRLEGFNFLLGIDGYSRIPFAMFSLTGGSTTMVSGATPVSDSVWTHLAMSFDGSTLRIYYNGRLDGEYPVYGRPTTALALRTAVGTTYNAAGVAAGFFRGFIDEVRFWNYARPGALIAADRWTTSFGDAEMLARFAFNEGSGTTVASTGSLPPISGTSTAGTWTAGRPAPAHLLPTIALSADAVSVAPGQSVTLTASPASTEGTIEKVEFFADATKLGEATAAPWTWVFTPTAPAQIRLTAIVTSSFGETAASDGIVVTVTAPGQGAVYFDGVDDFAELPASAELAPPRFTVETWFRRDGVGSGIDGIGIVPLVAKGTTTGNSERCDYLLGINPISNTLFGGLNTSSLSGSTPILNGVWYHAALTFNGTNVALYLNGLVQGSFQVTFTPFSGTPSLATLFDWRGQRQGRFHGALDEVRIWSSARTTAELIANATREIHNAPGLVARWGLDEASGSTIGDSGSFSLTGTLRGGASRTDGVTLTPGIPPSITLVNPAPEAVGVTVPTSLSATVAGEPGESLDVAFYGREIARDAADFTIAVIPDSVNENDLLLPMLDWVAANRVARNIAFVTHTGSVVNSAAANAPAAWLAASAAFGSLESPSATGLPLGVPFGLAPGDEDAATTQPGYQQYFGRARFAQRPWFAGGENGANNLNHLDVFTAGGVDFAIAHLAYDAALSASSPSILWLQKMLILHRDRQFIVVMHDLLTADGSSAYSTPGGVLINAIYSFPNVALLLGGHAGGELRRTESAVPLHSLSANFTARPNGGDGWMRLIEFSPTTGRVHVRTWSPTLGVFENDTDSDFTLRWSSPLASPAWSAIGTASGLSSGDSATVPWPQIAAGRRYEWYAVVTDEVDTVPAPVRRFTSAVQPAAQPPVITLTAPADGTTATTPATIFLSAEATSPDDAIERVEFIVDGITVATDAAAPFGAVWQPGSGGTYLVSARATDRRGGQAATSQATVTVQNGGALAPVVALGSVGTVYAPDIVPLSATASIASGSVARVDFFANGALIGSDSTAPFQVDWNVPVVGAYSLFTIATSAAGTSTISTPVTVNAVAFSSLQITRQPYLQMPAPTAMTLRWRTNGSVRGRVRYGPAPGVLNLFADETVSRTDHEVRVTGLTPSTRYYYSVGTVGGTIASNPIGTNFVTSPPVGRARNTRIWVIGDCGEASLAQAATRDAYTTFTGARGTDFVLALGDNAYNSGLDTEYQTNFFNYYTSLLRTTPVWSALGNHETALSTSHSPSYAYYSIFNFPTAAEVGGVASGTEQYYSFNYANIHFVCLDSMTSSRATNGPMANWLRSDLAVGSSRVDLQACKLEYSIVSPK